MGDLSEELPSRSDTSSRQLSIADLKAAREQAAAAEAAPLGSSDAHATPALKARHSGPVNSNLLPPSRSNDFVPQLNNAELAKEAGDWNPADVLKVLAAFLAMALLWWGLTAAINVYIPIFALLTGAGIGLLTQRLMGTCTAFGVFAAALSLVMSYAVLLLGVVIRGDFMDQSAGGGVVASLTGAAMIAVIEEGPRWATPERLMTIPLAAHILIVLGAAIAYWGAAKE
jgi:hypothetical protein